MLNIIRKNITDNNLLNKNDNVMIGLSGGPDSVFLFHILRKLKDDLRFMLYATHINHMYRGIDADNDENFVKELCAEYNVELFILRKNAKEYAKETKLTEEEAGRKLRYEYFNKKLDELGGGKIAVAHNMDDQSETVIQRIIRGTGIDGLKAMSFSTNNIIRPILNISREEIENHLEKNNYNFCIDKTNLLPIYGRNKVRLELIPYIEKNFNSNIKETLFRMTQIFQKESLLIEKYTDILYDKVVVKISDNKVILRCNLLNEFEDGEIARVLRKAIEKLKGNTINIESKHVDYVIGIIKDKKTGRKIDLSCGLYAETSYNNLIIGKKIEKTDKFEYNIIVNSEICILEVNKKISTQLIDCLQDIKHKHNTVYLDAECIKGGLSIRNRRDGDAMIPFGMKGKKKLKDIFIDNKVPRYKRNEKLILADDENILWIEDFRINELYKITKNSKKYLKIQIMED